MIIIECGRVHARYHLNFMAYKSEWDYCSIAVHLLMDSGFGVWDNWLYNVVLYIDCNDG